MLKFGLGYDFRRASDDEREMKEVYAAGLDAICYAEELGFDYVFLTEHHFVADGYAPSIAPLAAAIAARTKRIRIGSYVLLLPFHNPLRLAEDLAVVDQLSAGRLDVGLAPGYKPDEFAVLGVPKSERGARTDEIIEILQLAWRGEPFSYAGRHFQFQDVVVLPPPVQQPGPPIWVGGSSLAAARRAARYGTCFMPDSGAGPDVYQVYRTEASGPPRVATNRVLFAADSRDKAWEICGDHLMYQFNAYRQW
jgi:probable F420-dependent oxidoreductase